MTSTRSAWPAACLSSTARASGSSGTTALTRGTAPSWRHRAASMSEFVSMMSPKRGTVPTGRISSPVGMIATTGRRATVTVDVPAGRRGGQVARAEPPARGHQGLPGREVLARRPHVPPARRVPRPLAAACPAPAAGAMTTLPSACGSRRSRTTTVSAPGGIGSPVSIHSNIPAGSRTVPPSSASPAGRQRQRGGGRGQVGRAHRDPVHGRAVGARRRPPGHDGRGGDPPERLADRDPLAVPRRRPRRAARVAPGPGRGDQPARVSESSHRSHATRGTGRTPPPSGLTVRPRYGQAPASCR